MQPQFQSDSELIKKRIGDTRPDSKIITEYLLERRLSDVLRNAPAHERPQAYVSTYKEYYEAVGARESQEFRANRNQIRLRALRKYLSPDMIFLEIGAGDGQFAKLVAPFVKKAYAVDVQDVSVGLTEGPANFTFIKESAAGIPLPDASVDFIFSDQFMEHLHPDDAQRQLTELVRLLPPKVSGGGGGTLLLHNPQPDDWPS